MAKLLSMSEVKGKAGVWRLWSALAKEKDRRPYSSNFLDNMIASDGKESWFVLAGQYHGPNPLSTAWLYEPVRAKWQDYVRGKPSKKACPMGASTSLVLLCPIS